MTAPPVTASENTRNIAVLTVEFVKTLLLFWIFAAVIWVPLNAATKGDHKEAVKFETAMDTPGSGFSSIDTAKLNRYRDARQTNATLSLSLAAILTTGMIVSLALRSRRD